MPAPEGGTCSWGSGYPLLQLQTGVSTPPAAAALHCGSIHSSLPPVTVAQWKASSIVLILEKKEYSPDSAVLVQRIVTHRSVRARLRISDDTAHHDMSHTGRTPLPILN
jgi:hypothetical protein